MDTAAIRQAFYDAQGLRPYKANPEVVAAVTPPGGEWNAVRGEDGGLAIVWGGREVACITYSGFEAGEIAMACRALPVMDAALRSIIALASEPNGDPRIREVATSVIEFVERPAPPSLMPKGDSEEESEWAEEERYPTDYYNDDDF